jgi:ABC-type branched-subunit amino acid transport system ATPase component
LCKRFGALAIAENINCNLERGARHALIGPNGAGKTTFVNLLTGALAPTSGRILEVLAELPPRHRDPDYRARYGAGHAVRQPDHGAGARADFA